jgi:hypothetical protein
MGRFGAQLEAMQKLKGKSGQQRVIVEHVHVHEGGKPSLAQWLQGERARGCGMTRKGVGMTQK